MNDRGLLELAAKAAGLTLIPFEEVPLLDEEGQPHWNPLLDDGDALRLAHKLGMDVDMCVCLIQYEGPDEMEGIEFGSTLAEVRRAIVRAAAEIGRSR